MKTKDTAIARRNTNSRRQAAGTISQKAPWKACLAAMIAIAGAGSVTRPSDSRVQLAALAFLAIVAVLGVLGSR